MLVCIRKEYKYQGGKRGGLRPSRQRASLGIKTQSLLVL